MRDMISDTMSGLVVGARCSTSAGARTAGAEACRMPTTALASAMNRPRIVGDVEYDDPGHDLDSRIRLHLKGQRADKRNE